MIYRTSLLFTRKNLNESAAFGFRDTLNATALQNLFHESYIHGYCAEILGYTREECEESLIKGCGLNDDCDFGQYCINNPR